jgi:ubiquinone/menaquinone biosynthesis C-methylase UbiE
VSFLWDRHKVEKSVGNCCKVKPDTILDIATGTDLAILMTQTNATKIIG